MNNKIRILIDWIEKGVAGYIIKPFDENLATISKNCAYIDNLRKHIEFFTKTGEIYFKSFDINSDYSKVC